MRFLVIPLLAALSAPAAAQDSAPPPARKQARAARIESRPPELDGRLDEAVWQSAPPITDFTQKQPNEGAPPTERTEVRFLYDADALYVGARMFAKDPSKIQAPVSRRDNGIQAEHIWISLDTYLDRRTAYSFGVTAAGTRMDWYHPRDDENATDASFDPVWEARVQRDSLGWTAEMRIPFSQLRFNALPRQTWGLNVDRWIPSTEEDIFWIPIPSKETGWSSRMGELVGIEGIRPTRRLELLPYVASGATFTGDPGVGNPFNDGSTASARAGGDVKMGLGPNLTLQATVNPDFGQVELDPAVVNLSAFETFFPERRPFFTEGSGLLQGGGQPYFYSRRIGQRPRLGVRGDYVDYPEATTILGAAKLTGRLPSGTSVGALAAVTDREFAATYDTATGRFGRVRVAPRTGYAVARTQQEFGRERSTVGVTLTGMHREVETGDPLASLLPRDAVSGGADWNLRFRGGEYEIGGFAGFSHVAGDSTAILRLQRSSARYFQRPDAGHVEVDSSRNALGGYSAGVSVARNSGKHWLWEVFGGAESPGFEINDVGRISTVDGVQGVASLRYRETRPQGPFRRWQWGVSQENEWNFGGVRQFGALRTDAEFTWKNWWRTNHTAWVDFRARNHSLSRGGPLVGTGRSWVTINQLSSSSAARTRWNARLYYGEAEQGGRTYRISGGISVRPGPRWQLSVDPNYLGMTTPRQYVATLPGGPAETFGRRYVFSFVDESQFSLPLRLNYLFTPDLSLELYAQPFAASGRFYGFGELPAAGSRGLREYTAVTLKETEGDRFYQVRDGAASFTLPYQDFSLRSLRSNAVLRWEWRPGSTLFVVWQQNRASEEPFGDRVAPWSVFESLTAGGNNYLAVKMSYWLPVR